MSTAKVPDEVKDEPGGRNSQFLFFVTQNGDNPFNQLNV